MYVICMLLCEVSAGCTPPPTPPLGTVKIHAKQTRDGNNRSGWKEEEEKEEAGFNVMRQMEG